MEARFSLGVLLLMIVSGVTNGFQCDERPRKLGCFRDSPSKRLMTLAFIVKMKNSDWRGDAWDTHLDTLLCKCAEEAKKGGYMYFGLQHYYECWVGNLDHVSNIDSHRLQNQKKCWSKIKPNYSTCTDADPLCVGTTLTMAIYEMTYSSYIITETEGPTIKVMTVPKKGQRPPPKIPGPPPWVPGLGRR